MVTKKDFIIGLILCLVGMSGFGLSLYWIYPPLVGVFASYVVFRLGQTFLKGM